MRQCVTDSSNQKLVLPRHMYFASAGSLQRHSLRGGATELHVPLPAASAAGEALTVHHLVRFDVFSKHALHCLNRLQLQS